MPTLATLFVPYKRRTHTKFKVESHTFHDPVIAEMAMVARLLEADMAAPTYVTSSAGTFNSTSALQTAVGVASSATDFGLMMLGYRIGYGASAAATGIPIRYGSCTFATNAPGTNSTTASPVQKSGRTIAATNITSAVNWTAEPTVKTYVDTAGVVQPFGGDIIYDERSDIGLDTFASGAMGLFLEHTPSAATATEAAIVFCRC